MKILLTGGTGFLGKNIVNYFNKVASTTYSVIPLSSVTYDLRDSYACKKAIEHYCPDVIIHAAGSVGGILANRENPGKFMYDNLIMGTNMIERTRQYCDKYNNDVRFIMLGTVCSYPKFTPVPFQESELWNGYPEETNAPYGIAKKALMKLGETYYEQYGLKVSNLIPVNMYGPYDHFNLTSSHVIPALIMKFYNAIKQGHQEVNVWGTGEASREFLYAEDCARLIHCVIDEPYTSPEPMNVGTGKEIKIINLVEEIADQMGYEGTIFFDKTKPDGQPRRCLDTSKIKQLFNFQPSVDFQTGLKYTIEWFLKEQQK
jgi:nucleoside-diphosphate-sugar epimerase